MASYDDTATVSGSVVSIDNGADDVPTKSLVVTIAPTLSGVSSVMETQTGKNLLKVTGAAVSGDLTVTPQADGTVIVNGQRSTALTWNAGQFIAKDACSIVFSGCSGGSGSTYSINIQKNNVYQADVYNGDSVAYNLVQGDVIKFIVVVRANVSMPNVVFSPMIRFSAVTDGTFEKYTETQYTASLGRTIYGGSGDVANGEGEITHGLYTFTGNEVYVQQTNQVAVKVSFTVGSSYQTGLDTAMSAVEDFVAVGCGAGSYLYVKTTMTAEDLKTYMANHTVLFVYVLATPTDFTFTGQEVPTRLGYNAFWSDSGDSEVTYYKSGYGYTSVTVHKETPDGEPVEQTAKLHKVIYGGTVDVVKGRIEEHYPFYEISSFNGMFGKVNNGYCFYVQIDGTAHTLSDIEPNCMIANQLFTYGTVSRASAPVWQYGGNDGTAKTHAFILPNDYDTLEKANAFLASLETPLKVTLKKTTPNVFTFPPISMETDDGENTLFANEGTSAITYRKETD